MPVLAIGGATITVTYESEKVFNVNMGVPLAANMWYTLTLVSPSFSNAASKLYADPIRLMTVSAPGTNAGFIIYDENWSCG